MPPTAPSRRWVLTSAIGLVATSLAVGCDQPGADGPAAPPPADPDPPLREQAAASVRTLIASYDATAGRHPELVADLAPLRAEHVAHLAALGVAPPTQSSAASPGASPGTPAAPADPRRARAALAAAETRAAADRVGTLAAASPDLARLLAAIGAGEAAHAALLQEGA